MAGLGTLQTNGGIMSMNRYNDLIAEVAKYKPKTILEVGTYRGDRGRTLVEEARKYNSNIHYYGFDLWSELTPELRITEFMGKKKESSREVAEANLKASGGTYTFIQGNTRETLKTFKPDRPLDFIFIDGGHSLETIESDWKNLEPHFHAETHIYLDDFYDRDLTKGCFRLYNKVKENYKICELLPTEDIQADGLKIRILRVYGSKNKVGGNIG